MEKQLGLKLILAIGLLFMLFGDLSNAAPTTDGGTKGCLNIVENIVRVRVLIGWVVARSVTREWGRGECPQPPPPSHRNT